MDLTLLSISWILLAIFIDALAAWFFYYYIRDKDKRKLMFAIAFFLASVTYLFLSADYNRIQSEHLILSNLYHWSMLPLMTALLFAISTSLFKNKKIDILFRIYPVILIFSLIPVFLPLSIEEIVTIIQRSMAIAVLTISGYLLIKTRDLFSLIFLMSMICFTAAGISLARNMDYLSILLFLLSHTFLTIIFIISFSPTKNGNEGIESYFSLTDRLKTTEKALNESEKRYKRIVENTSDAIMITQPDGVISYMSPACKNVLQYAPKDLVGKVPKIFHPDDVKKVNETFSQALNGKHGSDFEYRIKTMDGETKWISHSWSPILKDGKLQMIVSSIRDITSRKKMEEKMEEKVKILEDSELATLNIMDDLQETITSLEKAEREIKELNEDLEQRVKERTVEVEKLLHQKDEFVNQLGHDLKNPLGPIINLLPIIEEQETNPESKEMFEVINRNVDYIKNLVTKAIQLARLNAPSTELSIEGTTLLDEINKVIERSALLLKENNIKVEREINKDIMVKADKLRLEELFDNLIGNSVKYSPNGGNITIDAKDDGKFVVVSVKDEGTGMNSEQLNHVFEEFYKADESRHDFGSSGLGLSICKRIVEKHGGKIWAESKGKGKGTTMFFTIPTSNKKTSRTDHNSKIN
jgi:PAS domain S-box-containing protein